MLFNELQKNVIDGLYQVASRGVPTFVVIPVPTIPLMGVTLNGMLGFKMTRFIGGIEGDVVFGKAVKGIFHIYKHFNL